MSWQEDIRTAILEISRAYENKFPFVAFVKTVATDKMTCECVSLQSLDVTETYLTEDADCFDVKIISNSNKGFKLVPKVGSLVIISEVEKGDYFIEMFSELDLIELNGINYDGLVKVADLVTKLNNLENKVNSIITAYNAHIHVETGASTAPTVSLVVGALTPTVQANLENTTVKHGNGI